MSIKWTEADVINAFREAITPTTTANNQGLLQQLRATAQQIKQVQATTKAPKIRG